METPSKSKSRGTFNDLENVGPNLYRHRVNQSYYGQKKISGVRKTHALGTTDGQIAKRKLAEWIRQLEHTDPDASDLTMAGLFERYRRTMTGKDRTRELNEVVMKRFSDTFPRMDAPLTKIRASDIAAWFAQHCKGLRHRSFNEYRRILKRIFHLALEDRVVPSPGFFSDKLVPVKKRQEILRNIPSSDQFAAILTEMREAAVRSHPDAEAADFAEFMGLAAVGQAEASTVEWEDIVTNSVGGMVKFGRVKTGVAFEVPLFANLSVFLDGLRTKRGGKPTGRIFSIKNCREAFCGAAKRLGFPHFTPRNLRSMRIVAWLDAGVDVKQIAEWQGHQDGGKLILDTYSEVIRSNKDSYLKEQIERAEGKMVRFQPAA